MKFSGQNVCQMYSCFCHFEHSEQNKTSAFVFYTRRPQHKTWRVPLQTVDSFSSFFPQTFVGFLLDSFQDVPLHPGRLFEQEVAASSRSRRSERTAHVVGTALDRFPPLSCLLSTVALQLDVVLCAHAPRPALVTVPATASRPILLGVLHAASPRRTLLQADHASRR